MGEPGKNNPIVVRAVIDEKTGRKKQVRGCYVRSGRVGVHKVIESIEHAVTKKRGRHQGHELASGEADEEAAAAEQDMMEEIGGNTQGMTELEIHEAAAAAEVSAASDQDTDEKKGTSSDGSGEGSGSDTSDAEDEGPGAPREEEGIQRGHQGQGRRFPRFQDQRAVHGALNAGCHGC